MDLGSVLDFLTSADGGALLVVLWIVSWGLEEFSWWNELKSKVKQLAIFGMAAVLGVVSVVLQNNPDVVAAINPYFQPLYYIGAAWLATQTFHKINKRLTKDKLSE